MAGLTVKFDPSRPAGSRVLEVMVGDEPLDLARNYAVATNDFMAAGGDGYEWFIGARVLFHSGDWLRDCGPGGPGRDHRHRRLRIVGRTERLA